MLANFDICFNPKTKQMFLGAKVKKSLLQSRKKQIDLFKKICLTTNEIGFLNLKLLRNETKN